MTTIHERINLLLETLALTPYQFAKALNYDRKDKVYNLVKGKTSPSWEMVEDIARTYTQVNCNWLLRGEGNIFKEDALREKLQKDANLKILTVTVDTQGNETIAMVPYKAQAGYRTMFQDEAYIGSLPTFSLPCFMNGTYRGFEVEGDSMTPTMRHADYVICSYVEKWEYLKPMNVYNLVTKDCITVKRVAQAYKKGSEAVKLMSDNRFYAPFEVAWEDVLEIWQVRGILTTQIPANLFDIQERILEMVDALDKHSTDTQLMVRDLTREIQERYLG